MSDYNDKDKGTDYAGLVVSGIVGTGAGVLAHKAVVDHSIVENIARGSTIEPLGKAIERGTEILKDGATAESAEAASNRFSQYIEKSIIGSLADEETILGKATKKAGESVSDAFSRAVDSVGFEELNLRADSALTNAASHIGASAEGAAAAMPKAEIAREFLNIKNEAAAAFEKAAPELREAAKAIRNEVSWLDRMNPFKHGEFHMSGGQRAAAWAAGIGSIAVGAILTNYAWNGLFHSQEQSAQR